MYCVPSPNQVQFSIAETKEDEWECQVNLCSDQEPIHLTQTDPTPVPPIEQEVDIPPEITLHPHSASFVDVSEDVAVSDARSLMLVEVSMFSHRKILLRFFVGRHVIVRCSLKFRLCTYCMYKICWPNDKFLKLKKKPTKNLQNKKKRS